MSNDAATVPAKPPLWRQLVDVAFEYRAHLIVGGGATAITNVMHWAWNEWSTATTSAYWQAYVDGLQHCWH
jgi:hypothetical protein